ncbi:hypothetical protein [Pedobacter borealis]|uniref:hypothetical protein n=1 Tax=Pedobacter borealis TaxID=475254 RepID=UPI000492EEAD|nr:hypothetical protein [Pedobacter borealis]
MIQELSGGLLQQLETELEEISFQNLSPIKKSTSALKQIRQSLKKLKSYLDYHPLSLAEQEISFFRCITLDFYQWQIYFSELYRIEENIPFAESHPLLKEISYEMESQGEPIVKLTDPHFKDSGIRFRAVLALVLGGIYYVVWQPEPIKVKSVASILMMKRTKLLLKRQLVRSLTPYGNWPMAKKRSNFSGFYLTIVIVPRITVIGLVIGNGPGQKIRAYRLVVIACCVIPF